MTNPAISGQRVGAISPLLASLIILAVAVATRFTHYGNPVADMDDQFYWLVGRSWWDGQWPIIDIWDRKPVGLFLIYGAIAGISRSIMAVQLIATIFAAATAMVVWKIARLATSDRASLLAALAYLLMLPLLGGQTGQSPVFYNLFMAGAAYLLLKSATDNRPSVTRANWAMLLCGLALLVKQVSAPEGMMIGLGFLWLMKRNGFSHTILLGRAVCMVAIALLPTIGGFALFWSQGSAALAGYTYAAYLSIFAKGATALGAHLGGLAYFAIFAGPFVAIAVAGWVALRRERGRDPFIMLLAAWGIAALVGYLLIPNFYPHYALPMLVPLSVMSAGLFARPSGTLYFAGLAIFALLGAYRLGAADEARYDQLVQAIRHESGEGCLFVANGPTALYTEFTRCPSTRIVFPQHLTLLTEAASVGRDQAGEVSQIFGDHPAAIILRSGERNREAPAVRATIDETLKAKYRLAWTAPPGDDIQLSGIQVWVRISGQPVN